MKNVHLLVIDPQKDFCSPDGSLFVPGSVKDMDALSLMIHKMKSKIKHIHVSLDNHHLMDISHPAWWLDREGNRPAPFTQITSEDVMRGNWTTARDDGSFSHGETLKYLWALEENSRYPHVVWPNHCLIGTDGASIVDNLNDALFEWTKTGTSNWVDFITKGTNPWTEHFSAIQAEVPDPDDPSTQTNENLLDVLEDAVVHGNGVIALAGEAGSHCVANTAIDIAEQRPELVKHMVLLSDTTSPVPSFEHLQESFVRRLTRLGMKVQTTKEFMKD